MPVAERHISLWLIARWGDKRYDLPIAGSQNDLAFLLAGCRQDGHRLPGIVDELDPFSANDISAGGNLNPGTECAHKYDDCSDENNGRRVAQPSGTVG